jgi:hypothetical protein
MRVLHDGQLGGFWDPISRLFKHILVAKTPLAVFPWGKKRFTVPVTELYDVDSGGGQGRIDIPYFFKGKP